METTTQLFILFFLPVLISSSMLVSLLYGSWKEKKVAKDVLNSALKGNPYAVSLLKKHINFGKYDQKLIYEALNGNKNALDILGVTPPFQSI